MINVKITDVRIVNLRATEKIGEIEPAWSPGQLSSFEKGGGSILKIETDSGVYGIGTSLNPIFLDSVRNYLIGKDPLQIELHSANLLQGYSLPYQGMAGVDIALWDILGKLSNLPLHKIWGGNRNKLIPYASMIILSNPDERAEMAKKLYQEGWKAIKLRLHHDSIHEDIKTVEKVRLAVGKGMTIMVDANQAQSTVRYQKGVKWDFKRAYETAKELENLDVYWLEEPLYRYDFDALSELASKVNLRIAGGENNIAMNDFLLFCEKNSYQVLQPESMVLGGITQLRKIGVLAEMYGKKIVPHHGGGGIGVIAHMHLVASWNNAPFMELLHDPPIGSYTHKFSIMKNYPTIDKDGYMNLPSKPGLGVEIDEDLII